MKSVNLSDLSDQELMQEEKKQKWHLSLFKASLGIMTIISIYNTYYTLER